MATVNHDSWDIVLDIILFLAEETLFFIEQLVDELIDLFAIQVRNIF